MALGLALACFCFLPPHRLALGAYLCIWRRLFHLSACPACGSTQALAALFHGRLSEAVALNPNVVVTAPGLLTLIANDLCRVVGRTLGWRPSSLRSFRVSNKVVKSG